MNRRPDVSVVVATFNWSAALRCALRSIELQSFRDFEVLAVGDGCTDDSADVVSSFGDPRFSWHNLDANQGSQWAPNNRGLALARGRWVAYLGHDDIWHPDHLRTLVAAAEAKNADGAVAQMLMYGPPGSGTMHAAGFLGAESARVPVFVPPSGLLHSRALADRIGGWVDAATMALPTDCDFFGRLTEAGTIVPSGELTVFKFNAAGRRDAYLRRSVAEQEGMLAKIASGSEFRHRELGAALISHSVAALHTIAMPDVSGREPGEISRLNRRFKGVEPAFAPSEIRGVGDPVRFSLAHVIGGYEWHGVEDAGPLGSYRWSGPLPVAHADLPMTLDHAAAITIRLYCVLDAAQFGSLRLRINGAELPHRVTWLADHKVDLSVAAPPADGPLRITFELDRTVRPIDIGLGADTRSLGIPLMWIEVAAEVAPSDGEHCPPA